MRAVVLRNGGLAIEDVAEPVLATGQVVVRPLACGVCGSDLHARDHAPHLCDLLHRAGFRGFMDPARPVVMGHEFCCEVLDGFRVGESEIAVGQRVVAPPFVAGPDGVELIGYSNRFPGAFAERMLLDAASAIPVPDHVPTEIAALTEPLSVAVHAVAESGATADAGFAVIGCGPVGLFVIARLKALGFGPVLAVEPNPARRAMAERIGADGAIAPEEGASDGYWRDLGLPTGLSDAMAQAPELRQRDRAILFDCVGKPGITMAIARAAPVGATIVTIGTCMEPDSVEPAFLLQKGLTVKFVFAYSPAEFAAAFAMIAADPDRVAPMVTGQVGLDGVERAFAALTGGGDQVKILVTP